MDLYTSAILVGFLLSLVFIGPVFFLLIETSITKGWKSALILNSGVVVCDLVFVFLIYYSLKDVTEFIEGHPSLKNSLFRIGGLILFIYGIITIFVKKKEELAQKEYVESNYFRTFWNGFLLNLLNVGIIFFWFGIVSSLAIQYPKTAEFMTFIIVCFGTFIAIDLGKIFLARKLKRIMNDDFVLKLKRILGIILIGFGILLISKSYGAFEKIDKKMQEELIQVESH